MSIEKLSDRKLLDSDFRGLGIREEHGRRHRGGDARWRSHTGAPCLQGGDHSTIYDDFKAVAPSCGICALFSTYGTT